MIALFLEKGVSMFVAQYVKENSSATRNGMLSGFSWKLASTAAGHSAGNHSHTDQGLKTVVKIRR